MKRFYHISRALLLSGAVCLLSPPLLGQAGETGCTAAGCHDALMRHAFQHEAAEDCESCHEAGDGDHPASEGREFEFSGEVPGLCYDCHDEYSSGKSVHSPVEDGDCLACHDPHSAAQPKLTLEPMAALCFSCHDDVEEELGAAGTVHAAVTAGRKCLACHSPHNAAQRSLLKLPDGELCLDCHDGSATPGGEAAADIKSKVTSREFVHDPAAEGNCLSCHHPHSGSKAELLTEAFPAGLYAEGAVASYALCFDCHDSDLLEAENTREATNFRDERRNLHYVHLKREKSRSCVHCHDLHGSDLPHILLETSAFGQWKMPLGFKVTENGGSCRPGCHEAKTYRR